MASRDFLLPDLGEGLEEAEIVTWRVAEGDTVELNQPLADVETAKAVVEIPSPFAGVIAKLHAEEGGVVKVGTPLVTFEIEGEAEPERPKREPVLVGYGPPPDEEPSMAAAPAAAESDRARVKATPPVRKLAREMGVDLTSVTGSGPRGRITREDVERAASSDGVAAVNPVPATGGAEAEALDEARRSVPVPVRGVRRTVAEHMARAWRDIPHVTTFLTVDFTSVLAYRDELQESNPEATIRPLAIVGRALAEIVKEHPDLNASWVADRGQILRHGAVNLGIATDTQDGLLVPVVHGADAMGIAELAAAIAEVAEAARSRTATLHQLTGSTMTITNVGSFGAEYGTPIINAPEAAILSVGVIEPKALVVEDEVVARPAAVLGLTFDHRVLDGAEAGRALGDLGDLLQSPFRLGALPR